MAEKLAALHARDQGESESGKISMRRKALLRVNLRVLKVSFLGLKRTIQLRTQLGQALGHSTLPEEDLLDYLRRIQRDIAQVLLQST